jgi:hypothetical protein
MRTSTHDSLWLRPKAAEGKESAKKGERMFVEGSERLLFINRTMKVLSKAAFIQSRMKSTTKSHTMCSLQMANHAMKGLIVRSHLIRGLSVRGAIVRSLIIRDLAMRRLGERNLIRKGDTERNLTTGNPTTTIAMKRWETSRRSKLSLLGRLLVKI